MDLKELQKTVKKLNDDRIAIVQAEGKKALSGAFKELFDKFPKLESVSWNQYTPYFNDGEACTFGVNDFSTAIFDGEEHDEPAYKRVSNKIPKEVVADLKEIERAICNLSDTMEIIFGDHAEITATRNGFEVNEYQHD